MSNTFGQSAIDKLRGAVSMYEKYEHTHAPALLEGQITNISDPGNLGRVRVLLDYLRGPNGEGYETPWIEPLGFSLVGLLPSTLVGRRVLIHTVNNSYENLRVHIPLNLLVYRAADLPPARAENMGIQVLVDRQSEHLAAVCLRRNGQWTWESLAPLYHLHLAGDAIFQANDSGGDFQQPIVPRATSDVISVTSVTPYIRDTGSYPKILS